MYFNNPFGGPFRLLVISLVNQEVTLAWESPTGRVYRVEASFDFGAWITLVSNVIASGTNCTFTTNTAGDLELFFVYRVP